MLLLDVNPMIYALRSDVPEHAGWRRWLESALAGHVPIGASNATLAAVLRIATNPRVFTTPTPVNDVLAFIQALHDAPAWLAAEPGARHWSLLASLVRKVRARGNLVSDAYLAALALETGAELITADGDFARFPGLHFSNPVEET